jgi:hypothetical protein
MCPVPDIINTAIIRVIGPNGQKTEELGTAPIGGR